MAKPRSFYEEHKPLFTELDEVTEIARDAMARGEMQAWVEAAGRGAEIHDQLARLREAASEETENTRDG